MALIDALNQVAAELDIRHTNHEMRLVTLEAAVSVLQVAHVPPPPPPPILPTIGVSDAVAVEQSGGVVVTVSLSEPSTTATTFHLTTVPGTAVPGEDYLPVDGDYTIPAGQTHVSVPITLINDTLVEPVETFTVQLSLPVNGVLGKDQGVVTINSEDIPPQTTPEFAALKAVAAGMPYGSWKSWPGVRIPLLTFAEAQAFGVAGTNGPIAVLGSWNGAAYDGRNIFFHGGGHADYGGNEFYRLDLWTGEFRRMNDPSPLDPANRWWPVDGKVPSTHTYGGFFYHPTTKKLYVFGTVAFAPSGSTGTGLGANVAFEVDPVTLAQRQVGGLNGSYVAAVAIPSTTLVAARLGGGEAVIWDAATETQLHRFPWNSWFNGSAATWDPVRNVMWALGYYSGGVTKIPVNVAARTIGADDIRIPIASLPDGFRGAFGGSFHTPTGKLVFWGGDNRTAVYDPDANTVVVHRNAASPSTPSRGPSAGVFTKWHYIPEADVFVGHDNVNENVWIYKAHPGLVAPSEDIIVQHDPATRPAAIIAAAPSGTPEAPTVVTLAPGAFLEDSVIVTQSNIIIQGNPSGTIVGGAVAENKGVFVTKGTNITLRNFTIEGVRGGDNWACIRQEGDTLTLEGMTCRNSSMGILTHNRPGSLIIRNSTLGDTGGGLNLSHVIYTGTLSRVEVTNSRIYCSNGYGHLIKSRAQENLIASNVIDEGECVSGRAIDLPQGGINTIRNNVIRQGRYTDNADIIGIARETNDPRFPEWPSSSTLIEANRIISDWVQAAGPYNSNITAVLHRGVGPVAILNNTIVWPDPSTGIYDWSGGPRVHQGEAPVTETGTVIHKGRAAAGLPAYPALPTGSN